MDEVIQELFDSQEKIQRMRTARQPVPPELVIRTRELRKKVLTGMQELQMMALYAEWEYQKHPSFENELRKETCTQEYLAHQQRVLARMGGSTQEEYAQL
ncbi:MAG: hypothetical protein NVS2B12_21790 [Ktedonobacteraceae bacterium]